jgi:hypothetical protein
VDGDGGVLVGLDHAGAVDDDVDVRDGEHALVSWGQCYDF